MVKCSTPEFSMSKKDFPPLSGFTSSISEDSSSVASWSDDSYHSIEQDAAYENVENSRNLKSEAVTSLDERANRVPEGMVKDQFGLMGLISIIRAAETNESLASLAFGHDLSSLGLDLNSSENLYPTFDGPWEESLSRSPYVDFQIPPEYQLSDSVKDKLAKVDMSRYGEEVLFYIFYNVASDTSQIVAAEELYCRGWRYHKEQERWMMPLPECKALDKSHACGQGTYYFFDAELWKKVKKAFDLDCSKLESRPIPETPHDTDLHFT